MTTITATGGYDEDFDPVGAVVANPLHSLEAEMSALGAMILAPIAALELSGMLKAEHFYRPAHQTLFHAISTLVTRESGVDFVSLVTELGPKLKDIGGDDYILQLCEYVPSPSNARHYGEIVLSKAIRRDLVDAGKSLVQIGLNGDKTLEEVTAFAHSVAEVQSAKRSAFMDLADVDIEEPDLGVTTGFPKLDQAISTTGYPKGQMTVVRAYHKGGKSTFKVSSFVELAKLGLRPLYATFADLNAKQLKRRMVRNLSGWSKPPRDLMALDEYRQAIADIDLLWNAFVYDASASDSADIESFIAWARAEHKKKPFDVIFIDYAQELKSSDRKATNEVSEQNICASKCARLAAQLDIPVIVGSQITEGAPGQKAKTKYSRAWEEKAGWVLTLDREDESVHGVCEVSYSRFGHQGIKLEMLWNAERLRWEF